MTVFQIIGIGIVIIITFFLGYLDGAHTGWSKGYNNGWKDGYNEGLSQKKYNHD